MTHGSLFSGIGGFDLAAEWAGIETLWQVEKDKKARAVLEKNFPEVRRYDDVFNFDESDERNRVDIISGGFPCQPFSVAGSRKGTADDRHLWPRMLEIIEGLQPAWVIAENVPGLLTIENGVVFESVCAGLESAGYEVWPVIIPACAVGALHKRDRVWIVANSDGKRRHNGGDYRRERHFQDDNKRSNSENQSEGNGWEHRTGKVCHNVSDTAQTERERSREARTWRNGFADGGCWEAESRMGGKVNGLSGGVDRFGKFWAGDWEGDTARVCESMPGRVDRIRQLGNSIVPQVAYQIFESILEYEAYENSENAGF